MVSYSTDFSIFGLNASGSQFNQKSGQISSIKQDFHTFILVVDEVEKSKQIHNEIDILINTNGKAPDPAVIETAKEDHKEVPNGQVRILIAIYLKVKQRFQTSEMIKIEEKFHLNQNSLL